MKVVEVIYGMGLKYFVIKKGEYGVLFFEGGKVFFVLVLLLVEVFDFIGVGDIFVGGFMGYIVCIGDFFFENMKCVVIYGFVMVLFCVEKFGIEWMKEFNNKVINKCIVWFVDLVNFDVDIEF